MVETYINFDISDMPEMTDLTPTYYGKMHTNLGIKRADMPQLWGSAAMAKVINWLTSKYVVVPKRMRLGDLKPTQCEMSDKKIKKAVEHVNIDQMAFITSKSNHIVDSHHSWAAALEKYGENKEVDVYKVSDLETKPLLKVLNSIKQVSKI